MPGGHPGLRLFESRQKGKRVPAACRNSVEHAPAGAQVTAQIYSRHITVASSVPGCTPVNGPPGRWPPPPSNQPGHSCGCALHWKCTGQPLVELSSSECFDGKGRRGKGASHTSGVLPSKMLPFQANCWPLTTCAHPAASRSQLLLPSDRFSLTTSLRVTLFGSQGASPEKLGLQHSNCRRKGVAGHGKQGTVDCGCGSGWRISLAAAPTQAARCVSQFWGGLYEGMGRPSGGCVRRSATAAAATWHACGTLERQEETKALP